jgi:hypothetical protein
VLILNHKLQKTPPAHGWLLSEWYRVVVRTGVWRRKAEQARGRAERKTDRGWGRGANLVSIVFPFFFFFFVAVLGVELRTSSTT